MSSSSKTLTAMTTHQGLPMATYDVMTILLNLPNNAQLTTSEAALFLRRSVTTLERWRVSGEGPDYIQSGKLGAKGTNQSILYEKADIVAWSQANKVSTTMQAAVRKGQAFTTLADLAQTEPFYVDGEGSIESMAESKPLETVMQRIGGWHLMWMTPLDAASGRWDNLSAHKNFANSVELVLTNAMSSVKNGVESSDILQSTGPKGAGPETVEARIQPGL